MSEKKPEINCPVSRFIPVLRPNSCWPKEKPDHHEEGSWSTTACIQKCFLHPFLKRSTVTYSTTQGKSLSLECEWHDTCVQAENRLISLKILLKNNPKWQQWGNMLPKDRSWAIPCSSTSSEQKKSSMLVSWAMLNGFIAGKDHGRWMT